MYIYIYIYIEHKNKVKILQENLQSNRISMFACILIVIITRNCSFGGCAIRYSISMTWGDNVGEIRTMIHVCS